MPIHYYLVVLLVALAVPFQSALAACQCFQETGNGTETGYLALMPISCTSTPSGFGWLKVPPDGGNPTPPMYVALRSSRTFSGCHFLAYNDAWPNGPSKVLLNFVLVPGCETNPPSLMFDFKPPDSERALTTCSTTLATMAAASEGWTCAAASRSATLKAEREAKARCASGLCSGSFTVNSCEAVPGDGTRYFAAEGTYTYACYATYNLCQ